MRQVIVLPFELRNGGNTLSTSLGNSKGLHSFPDNIATVTGRTHAILHLRFLIFVWSIVLIEPIHMTTKDGGFIDCENPENSRMNPDEAEQERLEYMRSLGWNPDYPFEDVYELKDS